MFYAAIAFNQSLSSFDTSLVTNMYGMFRFTTNFNQNLSGWCVSQFSSEPPFFSGNSALIAANKPNWGTCSYIFTSKSELQTAVDEWIDNNSSALVTYGAINTWNVSQIEDMSYLFSGKSTFNEDISDWDTSKVTNMSGMFYGANAFNNGENAGDSTKPLNFDTSKVVIMTEMFRTAASFNQSLSSWDTSLVTNMYGMFYDAAYFNQSLSSFDTSKFTDM